MSDPTRDATRRFIKIRPKEGGPWLMLSQDEVASLWDYCVQDAEPGDEWQFEVVNLTDEEAANLGEFDGW